MLLRKIRLRRFPEPSGTACRANGKVETRRDLEAMGIGMRSCEGEQRSGTFPGIVGNATGVCQLASTSCRCWLGFKESRRVNSAMKRQTTFLEPRCLQIQGIFTRLETLLAGALTDELASVIEFIRSFLEAPDRIHDRDPCKTVGDLLIALESVGIPTFYTINDKESQHLCRAPDHRRRP